MNKKNLFIAVFQLLIGVLAIVSFIILGINDEKLTKWIITLILAILYVILGIIGIIDYKKGETK